MYVVNFIWRESTLSREKSEEPAVVLACAVPASLQYSDKGKGEQLICVTGFTKSIALKSASVKFSRSESPGFHQTTLRASCGHLPHQVCQLRQRRVRSRDTGYQSHRYRLTSLMEPLDIFLTMI